VERDPPWRQPLPQSSRGPRVPRVGRAREREGTASEKQAGGMSSTLHTGGGRGSMRNHTHAEIAAVVWGLLLALVAVPQRVRARIVALADEHGRTVRVNANVRELRIAPRNLPGQAR